MVKRGLLAGARITAWEKRHPKSEREDDTAAGRQRAKRARDAADAVDQSRSNDAKLAHVTPRHATSHPKAPRGEESREEKREEIQPAPSVRRARAGDLDIPEPSETPTFAGSICRSLRKAGVNNVNPGHPRLLALIEAGAAVSEFLAFVQKAVDEADDPFAYLLGAVEGERKRAARTAGQIHRGPLTVVTRQEAVEAENQRVATAWLREQEGTNAGH
jgi:hypothetical protein